MVQEIVIYLIGINFLPSLKYDCNSTFNAFKNYFFLFIAVVVLATALSFTLINSHDIFIIRNFIQLLILIKYFDYLLNRVNDIRKILYTCLIILSFPALIGILEYLNIFQLKSFLLNLYPSVSFFRDLGSLSEYRVNSIFKDFFTGTVYYSILVIFTFYIIQTLEHSKKAYNLLFLILLVNVVVIFFTGRTGIVLCMAGILGLLLNTSDFRQLFKNLIFITFTVGILIMFLNFLFINNDLTREYISHLYLLLDWEDQSKFASVSDMYLMNTNFKEYLLANPRLLFFPNHVYDLSYTDTNSIYTDNFYYQEIYRYGIYGIIALLIFSVRILKKANNNFIKIIILLLLLANYKGGNTFLMSNNIFLYAFIFSASEVLTNSIRNEENFILNT